MIYMKITLKQKTSRDKLCKLIKQRVSEDWDLWTAITGTEGVGKSNLADQFGFTIDPTYTLERNELFSPTIKEMEHKLRKLPKGSVIIVDEAVKVMIKHDWYLPLQKYLVKLSSLARKENKIVLCCIPSFITLNKYFRQWRVGFWINIPYRGIAINQVPHPDMQRHADPWLIQENLKREEKAWRHRKFVDITLKDILAMEQSFRTYGGWFEFPDWQPERKVMYERLRDIYKYEDIGLEYQASERYRKLKNRLERAVKVLLEQGFMQKEIATQLEIPVSSVSRYAQKFQKQSL